MGMSMSELLLILAIVILVFGTKRLKNVGADLGDAIKNFRSSMKEGGEAKNIDDKKGETLDGEITHKEKDQA
ncbi:twin-arginine translocase TatA/TatE family subunit [Methylomonas rapida]|jgi:twin arginine-targeting protein translocase, TatA/E family|uniref:Sec-independent protein translocase protein TatA n=1 Tax=Methylomonas rapida TaxID=2963939 RepID=A0ABY7GKJ3_9GAMM|nr:twin-arginine translocase TatA/TatE family subunit [Methylomonas rapida]WAR45013.1 twin-arginine translocase TatA/TatE family subunit [Methylomonas rapida]